MARALARLAVVAGWAVLGALSAAGLALSALSAHAALLPSGPLVRALVAREVGTVIAGRLTVEGVAALSRGGVEVRGLELRDPDGHVVLAAPRARIFVDLTRLARRQVGLTVEVDTPTVSLATEPNGDLSIARAFASPRPAEATPGGGLGIRLTRLTARGGGFRWLGRDGGTALEVAGMDLDADGSWTDPDAALRVRLRGEVEAPLRGPLALSGEASLRGDRLEVPRLDVAIDATSLEVLGELDVRTGAFRAAVRRLGLAAGDARQVVPSAAAPGGDLAGSVYAESDGAHASAALEAAPAGEGHGGTARVALAVRTGGARAIGLDVALAAFDPSLLLAQAPPGRLDLTARGAIAGRRLADARGRVTLALARSRLRGTELGPADLVARAERGLFEVERLDAHLPGVALKGHGTWREHGEVSGSAELEASDLGAAGRAIAALSGASLPPLSGRLHVRATLAGTADAPALSAKVDAPRLGLGAARAGDVSFAVDGAGPISAGRLRVTGRVASAEAGGTEARGLELAASISGDEATFALTGSVPSVGQDPVAVEARAHFTGGRRGVEVRALSIRWPGARFALVRPATLTFAPLAVDRLELADGSRSVALSGGFAKSGALELRLEVVRLDLAALPRGLVPPEAGLKGELTLDLRATGPATAPALAAHVEVANGALRGAEGLQLLGDLGWDGKGRLTADLGLLRTEGGAIEIAAALPVPVGGARPGDEVAVTVDLSAWPLETLRRMAGVATPQPGTVRGRLALAGTVAAPRLTAALAVEGAALGELRPLAAEVDLLVAEEVLRVTLATRLADAPLVSLDASAPLSLPHLLRDPEGTLRALARAPLTGRVEVAALDLARVSGKAGVPAGLAGTLSGEATLAGTPSAPRGRAKLAIAGGAAAGYRDVAVQAEVVLDAERTALVVRASVAGVEALRADASLGAPVERLLDPARLRTAPLAVDATVPSLKLVRTTGPALPLEGTIAAHLTAKGSAARPEVLLDLDAKGLALDGRAVGDLAALIRHDGRTTRAEVALRSAAGGTLRADATLETPRGLEEPGELGDAEATVHVTSDRLDLGFLAILLPGTFRSSGGRLTVELSASGPVAKLWPRGTVRLEGGRLDIVEVGSWTGLEVTASLDGRSIEVSRLEGSRRGGHLSGQLSARDLGSPATHFSGKLTLAQVPISYGGEDLVTLDLPVELEGTLEAALLDVKLTVTGGTVRLPRKASGSLQGTGERADIVEADLVAERARRRAKGAPPRAGDVPAPPFEVRCRVVIPDKLAVKSERPAMNIELKGDSTWRVVGDLVEVKGTIETVRGTIEPIAARIFHLERGRVTFPGGPVSAGGLDVVARYDNPAAVVTVTIDGTIAKPALHFSSEPPLDDAKIAMLIATGRTEMNVGTSSAPLTAQEASAAVIGAAMSTVFSGLVSDKLPVDQISMDTTRLYAGKYVTDSLFVGYVYRLSSKAEEGENVNEVRAEYRLSRSWRFVLRYGDASVGDASIIWTRDY